MSKPMEFDKKQIAQIKQQLKAALPEDPNEDMKAYTSTMRATIELQLDLLYEQIQRDPTQEHTLIKGFINALISLEHQVPNFIFVKKCEAEEAAADMSLKPSNEVLH